MQSMTPRWWMVPNYDPLLTDGKGLAWEIRRASVKALTEETFFGEQGSKAQTGKVNPVAQAWANNFTNKYDELSLKDTIFGQLRNCMDLAVLAALIVKQDLSGKAGYQLPLWLDDVNLPAAEMDCPAHDRHASQLCPNGGTTGSSPPRAGCSWGWNRSSAARRKATKSTRCASKQNPPPMPSLGGGTREISEAFEQQLRHKSQRSVRIRERPGEGKRNREVKDFSSVPHACRMMIAVGLSCSIFLNSIIVINRLITRKHSAAGRSRAARANQAGGTESCHAGYRAMRCMGLMCWRP